MVPADAVQAAPLWVLIVLISLAALIIVLMFGLTLYNLNAPRATFKLLIGVRGRSTLGDQDVRPAIVAALQRYNAGAGSGDDSAIAELAAVVARSAKVGKRTTRTTLAIGGLSLLAIALVALFSISGDGIRDLRSSLIGAIVTLVAAVSGFYFGAGGSTGGAQPGGGGDPDGGPGTVVVGGGQPQSAGPGENATDTGAAASAQGSGAARTGPAPAPEAASPTPARPGAEPPPAARVAGGSYEL